MYIIYYSITQITTPKRAYSFGLLKIGSVASKQRNQIKIRNALQELLSKGDSNKKLQPKPQNYCYLNEAILVGITYCGVFYSGN